MGEIASEVGAALDLRGCRAEQPGVGRQGLGGVRGDVGRGGLLLALVREENLRAVLRPRIRHLPIELGRIVSD